MQTTTLANIDNKVQLRLRNIVNSPLSQSTRVDAYNDVIDYLQSKANWDFTRKVVPFYYLNRETDYSLSSDLSVTDFKKLDMIRFPETSSYRQYKKFEEVDSQDLKMEQYRGVRNNIVNFEERDGDIVMQVLADLGTGDVIIDEMDDLTTGRTWTSDTANSDATTLAQDTVRAKSGNSLRFNIDVDQSGNDFSRIYTSTVFTSPYDATDYLNIGYWRFWLGLHGMSAANLALISSVTFVWGSDASADPTTKANYWSQTVTTPVNTGAYKAGWNRMSFDWETATQTGSPDVTNLRYFEIQVTYTSGLTDTNNVRVDQIKLFNPAEAEFVYFSSNFVSNSGTWQQHFTTSTIDTTEILLLPDRHVNMFVNLALRELFPQKERGNDDYIRVSQMADSLFETALLHDGEAINVERDEFAVEGNSNGRIISTQW